MKTTVNNDIAKVISDENKTNVYTENKTYTIKGITNIANTTANQQKAVVSNGGKLIYESDHNKLTNRDKVDQHPISAITGLEEALKNAGNIKEETDPTVPKHVKNITEENINTWNNKSNFSGKYKDLEGQPTIPSKTSELNNDSGFITAKDIPEVPEPKTYKATDNVVIEDNIIKVVTNTGYKVSDKDIQMQPITDSGTTGTNKMVYTDDEVMFIFDGSNKLRRSKNGIDFEVLHMPRACKDMLYMNGFGRLMALSNDGYFFYSDDLGETWEEKQSSEANNADYLYKAVEHTKSFGVANIANKTLFNMKEDLTRDNYITSTITPNFWCKVNSSQYVWCTTNGTFKYRASSREGNFASLSGITINLLKRVNDITMIGLKANNKIYLLEPASIISNYKWVEYNLPNTCTANDIIYNHYDKTYYIFTNINAYYKTKDFLSYESVDKNSFRGIQGYFTLMGIQMTTAENNYLLLAPTRTTLENKAQEWDRALNKELWVGDGLGVDGEKIYVKARAPLRINENGIFLSEITEDFLNKDVVEGLDVAKAEIKDNFDPYEIESWYWDYGMPYDSIYKATKFIFNQAGSFYDQVTFETEYIVEQYEYGYIFCDQYMTVFKYVKLGNLAWLFNKGE